MLLYHPPGLELDLVGIRQYQSGLKHVGLSRLFDSVAVPPAAVVVAIVAVVVVGVVVVVVPLVLAMRQCYYYCQRRWWRFPPVVQLAAKPSEPAEVCLTSAVKQL